MKYFRYILLPFLLLLSLAGCTRDEVQIEKTGDVRLSLNIPETIQSKSTTIYPGESTISNVYILFYAQGADDTDKPAFFHSATELSGIETTWSKSFKTTEEMSNLVAHTTYDVYALASLPDGVTPPTATTTKAELLNLQEEMTKQTINDWKISFSGTATYRTGTLGDVPIELKRTIARLEINVVNNTSSSNLKLWLAKAPASTFYLKSGTTSTLAYCNTEITNASSSYRCYLYENPADSDPVVLFLTGTTTGGEAISHTVEVKPGNNSKIERNTSYNVTIQLYEGDITVSTGTSLPWGETLIESHSSNKIDVLPSANTYIIKPNSEMICFPIDRPNLANKVYSTIPTIAVGEPLTAELVWTDVKGSTGKGLADDASIAEIKVIRSGSDAFIQIKTGSQPGNSVVAVKDQDGTIKWSWQIWVTDYDPETDNGTLDGITYMDRNIGALQNSKDPEAIGTYYQWGRPHPFPTRKKDEHIFTPVYDADGNTVTIATSADITNISQTIATPATYATKYAASESLWDENQKTVFDPCPAGWRVPSIAFLNSITYESATSTPPSFQVSGTNIFFPITSYIDIYGTLYSQQLSYYTWSSTKSGTKAWMRYGSNSNAEMFQATGCTVRCIKQTN